VIRLGLIAAVALLASLALAIAGQSARAAPADPDAADIHHYCAATDRQFIEAARVNIALVGLYGDDYIHGTSEASAVVSAANNAVIALKDTSPYDPSLVKAQRFLESMFVEYGRAVHTREKQGDASSRMYRAYTLGEHAHHLLALAQAPLAKLGCDVHDLL
jgi:hypothetical protein